MRAFRWRSINVLVVVGFAVVGLPLVVAILLSTIYLERLTLISQATVVTGIEGTRQGRILGEELTALERYARQYEILGEPALLELFERRRERFEAAAIALGEVFTDARLDAAIATLLSNARTLTVTNVSEDPFGGVSDRFAALLDQSVAVNDRVRALTEARMASLEAQSERIQERLVWQATGVIVVALLLAVVFTVMISRAVRQLAGAIKRLGEGRFENAIDVRGPEDFEQLGGQLDWLRRRLQTVEEDKSAFLRNISHELKTPLANIREGSELLVDGATGTLTVEQREVADILRENSLRLQSQIENLLNFSAWQNLRTPLKREPVALDELVERVLERNRLPIHARQLRVFTELDAVTVPGDPQKLEVMIENLVSNAVKYSPPQGRLHIHVERQGRTARLLVSDDGPGIEPEERKRVFRAFYQGRRQAESHVHGTGLGLSVVQECVRTHRGRVTIIDGETHGATFLVELPTE
ncbi:MAG TPA: ATP-binding protein [Gammaproteobacteria bacterium]